MATVRFRATQPKTYRWKARKSLVEYLRDVRGGRNGLNGLIEALTDLQRSGSWLASEAGAAIFEASDGQFERLLSDVRSNARKARRYTVSELDAAESRGVAV